MRKMKELGLIPMYYITKVSTGKEVEDDCIVLKFKDPEARAGIRKWAIEMGKAGYIKLAFEVIKKCDKYEV